MWGSVKPRRRIRNAGCTKRVTFVVCRDGYRAIVESFMKGFNPLSVADIAKTIGAYWKSEPGKDIKDSHFRGDVDLLG
ncbi:hypothetical protein MTO96_039424, partial [Rhipicephalus appendiculatus]